MASPIFSRDPALQVFNEIKLKGEYTFNVEEDGTVNWDFIHDVIALATVNGCPVQVKRKYGSTLDCSEDTPYTAVVLVKKAASYALDYDIRSGL